MIILAVMALFIEFIITQIENRVLKWRPAPFSGQER
jgi:NitT/TauT family transport system permease protein